MNMKNDIIANAFANLDPDNEKFVENNTSIVEEIYQILENKKLNQTDLASMLGKRGSEISKLLSGVHNLTLRSISKMEVALGQDIIMTCSEARKKYEKINYVHINTDARKNNDTLSGNPFKRAEPVRYAPSEVKNIA